MSEQYSSSPARRTLSQPISEAIHLVGARVEDSTSLSLSSLEGLQDHQQQGRKLQEILSRGLTNLGEKLVGGTKGAAENAIQVQTLAVFKSSDTIDGFLSEQARRLGRVG